MLGLKLCATKPGPISETFYLSGSMKWAQGDTLAPSDTLLFPATIMHWQIMKLFSNFIIRKLWKIERHQESAYVKKNTE